MPPKLAILQIAHSYAPEVNGVSEVVRRISEGLVRRGHRVHVATGHCRERKADVINGVSVSSFHISGNWLRGYVASPGEIERFRTFVFRGNWDVQANHLGQVWCTDLLFDLLPQLNRVKVYTPHGMPSKAVPEWAPYYRMLPALLRSFDAVTCLSETFDEKPFCDAHGISHAYVIPNGVDPAEFQGKAQDLRREWKIGDRPWVLNVSNHSPLKGHRLLFQLARSLPARSVVVNIGNSHFAEKWGIGAMGVKGGCYYSCRVRSCFGARVQLRQHVPRTLVTAALRAGDVFVLPSSREASPLVILEAMAAGIPWIGFRVGNVSEHPGGIVVDTFAEMIDWTNKLLANPSLRAELGAAGRERALSRHAWDGIIDRYEELYCTLTRNKTSKNVHPEQQQRLPT
jgi:glycosyltransferase involved in cell wall biosynthesis